MSSSEWFADWFDSPYYHILYGHRDENEAISFVENLLHFIKPKAYYRFWDMACGNGRHVRAIADQGYMATGTDLSPNSIKEAHAAEKSNCAFHVHDMRQLIGGCRFNVVINLFTSLGYFDKENENETVFKVAYTALKKEGVFVLDYLNAHQVIEKLIPQEIITKQGISFHISRKIEHKRVMKEIQFNVNNQMYRYTEKVNLLFEEDFLRMAEKQNFKHLNTFGDYSLSNFAPESSPRLILIFQKN